MRPIVNGLQQQYAGQVKLTRVTYRDERIRPVVEQFGSAFKPAFAFVQPDGTLYNVLLGELDSDRLAQEIERLIAASR